MDFDNIYTSSYMNKYSIYLLIISMQNEITIILHGELQFDLTM